MPDFCSLDSFGTAEVEPSFLPRTSLRDDGVLTRGCIGVPILRRGKPLMPDVPEIGVSAGVRLVVWRTIFAGMRSLIFGRGSSLGFTKTSQIFNSAQRVSMSTSGELEVKKSQCMHDRLQLSATHNITDMIESRSMMLRPTLLRSDLSSESTL